MAKKYINKYPVALWCSFELPESEPSHADKMNRTVKENSTWFLKGVSSQEILFKLKGEECLRGINVEVFKFAFIEVDENED